MEFRPFLDVVEDAIKRSIGAFEIPVQAAEILLRIGEIVHGIRLIIGEHVAIKIALHCANAFEDAALKRLGFLNVKV